MVCVLPVQVLASQQHDKEALLKKLIVIMQRDLQASDKPDELSPISLRTQSLLNDLLIALESKNNKQLKAIVDDYATDMAVLQDETPVNPQCLLSLWGVFDMLSSLVSTLRTIAAGGDNACLIVDIASNLGSIIAAIQSYRICEIMNSELPDQTLCQQIVQRQTVIKMYNYIAKVLNVLLCSGTPAVSDYVSLVWGFLGLFPGKDVCTPQVPAP
jgi:ribosomal silencing factor RsfS